MTHIPGGAPAGFGGEVVGDRLKGSIAPSAGGDWLLIGQDGYGRLDVRNTVVTVDVELTPVAEARILPGPRIDYRVFRIAHS